MPRLENWILHNFGTWSALEGDVFEDPRFADGDRIHTSYLRAFSLDEKKATTRNTVYALGRPAGGLPREEDVVLV
jgi:hypothetical protein